MFWALMDTAWKNIHQYISLLINKLITYLKEQAMDACRRNRETKSFPNSVPSLQPGLDRFVLQRMLFETLFTSAPKPGTCMLIIGIAVWGETNKNATNMHFFSLMVGSWLTSYRTNHNCPWHRSIRSEEWVAWYFWSLLGQRPCTRSSHCPRPSSCSRMLPSQTL